MPQPVTFDDFSGGITDRYLDNEVKRAARFHNLLLDEVNKPYVRNGTEIYASRLPVSANQRKPTGVYIDTKPFERPVVVVGEHAFIANGSSNWTEIQGPETNAFLPGKTDATYEGSTLWRRQLISCAGVSTTAPQLLYCSDDSSHQMNAITVGLPQFATTPTTAATGSAWSGVYAFFYKYVYTDYLGTQYEFFGNPVLLEATNATGDPAAANITLTAIPALANTAYTNYDVVTITKEIYRTINGGQNFFFLASIANATTSYVDSASDTAIQNQELIYTAGGALGYDAPPVGAFAVTQVYDYFWYITPTTIYQSIAGNPGACPVDFASPLDQKLKGISNNKSYPILFCERAVYRIEGTFDDFGNGGYQPREVSQTAGCISGNSIVNTPLGIFWFGNGGIYWTDGFSIQKVSFHLDDSYSTWSNGQVSGWYDPNDNLVYWTISSSPDNETSPNDTLLALDLRYGVKPECVFTTAGSPNNIYPTAGCFSNSLDILNAGQPYSEFYNRVAITDGRGYLLYFSANAYTDPWIDTTKSPVDFFKKTIIYDWTSAGLNHGTSATRKYTGEVAFELDAVTQVSMQVRHRRDDGGAWSGTGGSPPSGEGATGSPGGGTSGAAGVPEMRQDGPITWDITDCLWLDDPIEHPWNTIPMLAERRTVPFGQLRSERRQLSLTNSFTNVSNSDTLGPATVAVGTAPALSTLTLTTSGEIWIDDPEGYYVTFSADNYVQTYMVAERVSDTVITLYDPYQTLTNGSKEWVMKGFRKFERPRIMSFTLYAEDDGTTFAPSVGTTGGN